MTRPCAHCGLPASTSEEPAFCCSACRLVYEAIREAGLTGYYRIRSQPTAPPVQPEAETFRLLDQIASRYERRCGDRVEATLVLEGMHCAACAWLVERHLGNCAGVEEARVNYATSRLLVRWKPEQLSLGAIAARVAQIGYLVRPYDPATQELARRRADRDLLLRLGVAGFAAGNTMMIASALYAGYFTGMEEPFRRFFHQISLLLATPVVLYSAAPFYRGAARALRQKTLSLDVPIALGLTVTYLYSLGSTLSGLGEVYFDTVSTFVFVLLVGRYLEGSARGRVSEALERLLTLGPRSAVRYRDGRPETVPVEQLVPGDVVQVLPGGQVPADGRLVTGPAWVDESCFTGESAPVARVAGDSVWGGTVCLDGELRLQVTRCGAESALAQVAHLVELAQARKPAIARLADRAAPIFVAATVGLAVLTLWLHWGEGPRSALMVAVSVLIITCPCALGLATPMAMAMACGRAASRGILFRDGKALEACPGLTHLLLDKTGTLTEGRPQLAAVLTAPGEDGSRALQLAARLGQASLHPLSRALVAASASAPDPAPEAARHHPGRGIEGCVEGSRVVLGSRAFVESAGCHIPSEWSENGGQAQVWLGRDDRCLAVFSFVDQLRPEARRVVRELRALGLEVGLVSGDSQACVRAAAAAAGIEFWRAGQLPADKERLVRELQGSGARVGLIGDGINDAPALSAAHVGFAMSSGADLSQQAADVVLLRPGLEPLLEALAVCRLACATVRQNLTISAAYNALALPVAMAGWVSPLVAAVAMPISSLLVVLNSWRTRS